MLGVPGSLESNGDPRLAGPVEDTSGTHHLAPDRLRSTRRSDVSPVARHNQTPLNLIIGCVVGFF